ncbi:MAG TPA: hypothetical protein VGD21_03035 [Lysobacter sp.]
MARSWSFRDFPQVIEGYGPHVCCGVPSVTKAIGLPVAEVADYAAFVASDRASVMTGAIANLSCGSLVD